MSRAGQSAGSIPHIETIQRTLDAIDDAKQAIQAIDPHPNVKADLDEAYRSVTDAFMALLRVMTAITDRRHFAETE